MRYPVPLFEYWQSSASGVNDFVESDLHRLMELPMVVFGSLIIQPQHGKYPSIQTWLLDMPSD